MDTKVFLIHVAKKVVAKNLLKRNTVKRIIPTISLDKFNAFFSHIKKLRDKVIVLLMYEGGLRVGEVLSLWIDDLFLWDKRIRILPKDNFPNGARVKSRVERFVDISEQLAKLLDDYLLFERPDCYECRYESF
ncbi:MAG: integrase/recombinase XerD [Clostridiales bacterium]|nr:integrase/recombinase XerD [Clostridiales bacterium]MDK2933763.1 integrase/recombinase XerD [Clostridiales bacterium]